MVVASIDLHICSFDSAWQNPKSPSPTKHTDFPLRSWINRDEVDDTDDDDDDDDDNDDTDDSNNSDNSNDNDTDNDNVPLLMSYRHN